MILLPEPATAIEAAEALIQSKALIRSSSIWQLSAQYSPTGTIRPRISSPRGLRRTRLRGHSSRSSPHITPIVAWHRSGQARKTGTQILCIRTHCCRRQADEPRSWSLGSSR